MARRPADLQLHRDDVSHPPMPPKSPFHLDLPSPRAGEQPPSLSPLDAIAMRSRLLAKRFEQPAENGRRISRLHHTDIAREFGSRPDYFRGVNISVPHGMDDVPEGREETSPISVHATSNVVTGGFEKERPMSHYPMLGNASSTRSSPRQSVVTPYYDAEEELDQKTTNVDYFGLGAPQATSPEPVDPRMINVKAATPTNIPSLTNSVDSLSSTQPRTLTNGSSRSQRSLAPPKSPAFPKSPRSMQSIRSVPPDSDEEGPFNSSQPASSSRKFSGSSGMSGPRSPFSPFMPAAPRSPSISSEFSMNERQRRTNFSRPLSSNSLRPKGDARRSLESQSSFETRPSTDTHHRQTSAASGSTVPSSGIPSRQASQDDNTPTPQAILRPVDERSDFEERPKTSYTYSSYSLPREAKSELPRGSKVGRDSRGTRESWIRKQFTWDDERSEEPPRVTHSESIHEEDVPAPPLVAREDIMESPTPTVEDDLALEPPPALFQPSSRPTSQASSRSSSRPRERLGRGSASRSHSAEPRTMQKAAALHKSTPSVRTHGTDSSDRTIRAVPLDEVSSADMTAEEHLEIGIQTHSAGELNKSTYHLRIAAREGSPTGMLLYALACRHGWGMRPNQEEGVRWLKKAIDGAGLQVADVEASLTSAADSTGADPVAQAQEKKKRKAQFALAIYELGISYMNGWGCAKDKPLALQCYEVAGSWGDCDALAEAGFCYAQGTGCKKDLKKAAALYRRAAEGGMSMAGNSW